MSHRMGRKFDRHQILREKDPWEVARNALDIALELALLGYIDKANELYQLFESFAPACKTSWSPGLYFAWEATNTWPTSISAEERTPEFLSKLETERILWKRETHSSDDGLDALIKIATGDGKKDAWGEEEVRADDLAAAIDLALYRNERTKALDILQVFADNFHTTWRHLSRSRQAWRYLKHRTMSSTIEVQEEKLTPFFDEVYATFKERLEKGPARIYRDLPIKDLVDMCNENTIKNAVWEEMDVDPDDPPETILHEPATDEQIKECEERIGTNFPSDFREFLQTTNGMETFWNGFIGEPAILSTDNIHIFDASEQQQVWQDAAVDMGYNPKLSVKVEYPIIDRVIQIGSGGQESRFLWLVEPEMSRKVAVNFFAAFAQVPPAEKTRVEQLLGYFHKGVDQNNIGWQTVIWCPSTLSFVVYHTFHEYLEVVAGDTANEDILEEEDEQGRLLHSHDIFAFQLR